MRRSGERIDWAGSEYQIDEVSHEVRYPSIEEPEHNGLEVAHRCGHIFVVTDEAILSLNQGCVAGINSDVDGRTRQEWIAHIKTHRCLDCRPRHIPEGEQIGHLMPSDSPAAY